MARHEPLHITVHSDDNNGHKRGTFTGPAPKMRVDVDDYLNWDLTVVPDDKKATFEVRFLGFFWPFANDPVPITDTNERRAVNPGSYLYAVQVKTSDGQVFTLDQCPEAEVG